LRPRGSEASQMPTLPMDGLQVVWSWITLEARLAVSDPAAAWSEFWATFRPGGKLHPGYLLENQYHLIIEACLLLAILYLLSQSRTPAKPAADALTEKV
jgi:hypothetical protein